MRRCCLTGFEDLTWGLTGPRLGRMDKAYSVECPECYAEEGESCTNYSGGGCAPHRRRKERAAKVTAGGRSARAQALLAAPGRAGGRRAGVRVVHAPAAAPGGRCVVCHELAPWGRSAACFDCLIRVELIVSAAGAPTDPRQDNRRAYAARYRYKAVKCGNPRCRSCPHLYYVYREWRAEGKAGSKYLGPSDDVRGAYERPQLRAARAGGWR